MAVINLRFHLLPRPRPLLCLRRTLSPRRTRTRSPRTSTEHIRLESPKTQKKVSSLVVSFRPVFLSLYLAYTCISLDLQQCQTLFPLSSLVYRQTHRAQICEGRGLFGFLHRSRGLFASPGSVCERRGRSCRGLRRDSLTSGDARERSRRTKLDGVRGATRSRLARLVAPRVAPLALHARDRWSRLELKNFFVCTPENDANRDRKSVV